MAETKKKRELLLAVGLAVAVVVVQVAQIAHEEVRLEWVPEHS